MSKAEDKSKFLKLARDRRKQAEDADRKQLERELEDLRFYAGDQWPADIKASRAGMTLGNGNNSVAVPARPCITINKTREPVRQVLNQERGSDMGIEIVPADDFGEIAAPIDQTEIDLREGLVRRIQRESKASDARTWAFARATIAGRGYYSVMTRYAPGKNRDQEAYVHRFYNQGSVLGDPSRQQPDGSDSEWWQISENVPWLRYVAEHDTRNGDDNRLTSYSESDWRTLGDEQPDWFEGEGDLRTVLVVDYFYTKRTSRDVVTYQAPDGVQEFTVWDDEQPEPPEGWKEIERHTDIQKTIKWAKIDGCDDDVLEETDWAGPDMPIIQVLGEELQPYDKERRVEGMVRPMREPCQGNNAMISKFVEMVAMTPVPTLMMAAGQQEGFEEWYKAATTRTLPYLLYNVNDVNGVPGQQPFAPANRDMPIAPVSTGLQMFDQAIQATSLNNSAFGQTDSSVKSAKHAQLLKDQSLQGTSNYLDNLMRSMRYEAQIINNLLFPIYGRPGRLARIIDGAGEPDSKLVGVPMTMQGGRPVQAPTQADGTSTDPNAKKYTLTKDAQFNVAIKISKNFDTRRQQEASILGELLGNAPQLMTWFGDLFFKNQDGPGHTEMADRVKVMLDPKILQMIEQKKQGQDIPPQVQAQMAQSKQHIEQLTQQLQQAGQQIQTEQAKGQAQIQIAQQKAQLDLESAKIQAQVDIQKAHIDNAARIEIARIGAAKEAANIAQEAAEERLATGLEQQHQVGMAMMSGVQGAQSAAAQQQHQAGMAQTAQGAAAQQQQATQQAAAQSQQTAQSHEADMQAQAQQAAADQQQAAQDAAAAQQPPDQSGA